MDGPLLSSDTSSEWQHITPGADDQSQHNHNSNSNSNSNSNPRSDETETENPTATLEDGAVVVLQHAYGQHLRVTPRQEGEINAKGGRGKFARWIVEVHGDQCKFRSQKSGRYLRIINRGSTVDVGGTGGKFTFFRFDCVARTIESVHFPGVFVSVTSDGQNVVAVKHTQSQPQPQSERADKGMRFAIITLPKTSAGGSCARGRVHRHRHSLPFSVPFSFDASHPLLVVRHAHGRHLRVNPKDERKADANGGQGRFARWSVELVPADGQLRLRLRSQKSGRYLRIVSTGSGKHEVNVCGGGGRFTLFTVHRQPLQQSVKLESVACPGMFVACGKHLNIRTGTGGQHCALWLLVQKERDGEGSDAESKSKDRVIAEQRALIEQQRAFIAQQQRFIEQLQGRAEPGAQRQNREQQNRKQEQQF